MFLARGIDYQQELHFFAWDIPFKMLVIGVQEIHEAIQVIATALDCFPELEDSIVKATIDLAHRTWKNEDGTKEEIYP